MHFFLNLGIVHELKNQTYAQNSTLSVAEKQ